MGIERGFFLVGTVAAAASWACAEPSSAEGMNVRLGASSAVRLGAATATVNIPLDAGRIARSCLSRLGLRSRPRLVLALHGITAAERPSVVYELYVDLPAGTAPDPQSPWYAGTLDFYALGVTRGGATQKFDVSALARRTGFDVHRIHVTFVPSDLVRPVEPGAAIERRADVRIATITVDVIAAPPDARLAPEAE